MSGQHLIGIKPHSRRKYRVLRKYLGACEKFSDKYQNFAYIDTHGGTGEVFDIEEGKADDGSVLTAAKIKPSFPCYVVEIDPDNYALLEKFTKNFPNVRLFPGDCNNKINDILEMIPRGEKFIFCFIDPQKLLYRRGAVVCPQLVWRTVQKIAEFPRTEVLLNVPLMDIMRQAGYVRDYPDDPASQKMEDNITTFYGSKNWMKLDPGDYRGLVRLYISERVENYYEFKGAILIRDVEHRAPLYYLVYGSKYVRGGEIMRDIMKKEWIDIRAGQRPIERYRYRTDREWLNAHYPLDLFIFDD